MQTSREQIPRAKQKLLINKDLQYTVILYSIIFAGITSCVSFGLALYIAKNQAGGDDGASIYLSLLWIIFLLAGGAIFGLFLTHRIAGPIYHLLSHMSQVNKGETTEPIVFRKRDFFSEIADPYNTLISQFFRHLKK